MPSKKSRKSLVDRGRQLERAGRLVEAGRLYHRALSRVVARPGRRTVRDLKLATLYHHLGNLEYAAGNWLRGEPFAREALRLRRRALGFSHPDVARDLAALAALLVRQKKYDEAERLSRRAIAILERDLGRNHPDLSGPLNTLAAVHQVRGRPRQAEDTYRRALAIDVAHAGNRHPSTARTESNLAGLLAARGRLDEAAALFRQAIRVFTQAPDAPHVDVSHCLRQYAGVLRTIGRRRAADACERRAKRLLARVDAVNDTGVAITGTINPIFTRYRLTTRRSRIHRIGVFAEEKIPAGRLVIEYTGERVARVEARRRWNPRRSYLFEVDAYWQLDGAIGGSGAELINHSCDPNLNSRVVRKRVLYYSERPIARGEELTVDYNYDAGLAPMPCVCGAKSCRGTMNQKP